MRTAWSIRQKRKGCLALCTENRIQSAALAPCRNESLPVNPAARKSAPVERGHNRRWLRQIRSISVGVSRA
jgi:hypothetical protein